MHKAELVMRRRNVLEFIKADPIKVAFTRAGELAKTNSGGKVRQPSAVLPAQRVRIVLNKRRYTNGLVNSEAGEIPHTDYLLIGMHTLNVEVNDRFQFNGDNYQITGIYGARTESHLCSIDFFGPRNDRGATG